MLQIIFNSIFEEFFILPIQIVFPDVFAYGQPKWQKRNVASSKSLPELPVMTLHFDGSHQVW